MACPIAPFSSTLGDNGAERARDVKRFGFLLIDDFALMSFASAIEPLRAANILAGRTLYDWVTIGVGREKAVASLGLPVQTQHIVGANLDLDTLIVCAAGNPAEFADAATLQWLRPWRGGVCASAASRAGRSFSRARGFSTAIAARSIGSMCRPSGKAFHSSRCGVRCM